MDYAIHGFALLILVAPIACAVVAIKGGLK